MKKNSNLEPQIRLAGFSGEWTCNRIDSWGNFYYGRSCPKWSVSDDAPTQCIRYGELYTKFGAKIDRTFSKTNMPTKNLRFSKGTEVLVPRVGEDPNDYNHCTWLSIPGIAIGEMISVYNTDQNPYFTALMFNATLQGEFAIRVEGAGVTNLYYEKLKDIPVAFPTIPEQQKISEFLEQIDKMVVLQSEKLLKLKKIKAAMLIKMFPQDGSSIPEIRFKGYSGPWENKKIGDLIEQNDVKNTNGEFGIEKTISAAAMIYRQEGNGADISSIPQYKVLRYGEIAFEGNRREKYPYGKLVINDIGDGIMSNRFRTYKPYSPLCVPFWKQYLSMPQVFQQKLMMSTKRGTLMNEMVSEDLFNQSVFVPSWDEQEKIGDYFMNLDLLINLQESKVVKFKNLKKALLGKMFV